MLLFNSQSFGSSDIIEGQLTFGTAMLIALSLTAGATLLMWMGELITQRGIGNGISLIFALDRRHPAGRDLRRWTNPDQVFVVMMPFIALRVIVGIVFVQSGPAPHPGPVREARRRPADDHGAVVLAGEHGGRDPRDLRRLDHGLPPTIAQLLGGSEENFWTDFATFFNLNGWAYVVGEVFFIIIFYFYTASTTRWTRRTTSRSTAASSRE